MTVYFVQKLRGDGAIKIGFASETYTQTLASRITSVKYECGYPIRLLGCVDGHFDEEQALHVRFAEHRIPGRRRKPSEWFYPADELLSFIKESTFIPDEFRADKQIKVTLDRDRLELLQVMAHDRGVDLSDIVNEALDQYLVRQQTQLKLAI